MLVTYDAGVHVRQPFTSDRAALAAGLDRIATLATPNDLDSLRRVALTTLLSIREAYQKKLQEPCDNQVEQPVRGYAESARQEVQRSLRGLALLVDSLAGVPGRKALLHVSDGLQLVPGQDLYELLSEICGGGQANGEQDIVDPTGSVESYQGSQAMLDAQRNSLADEFRKLTDRANATLTAGGVQSTSRAISCGLCSCS